LGAVLQLPFSNNKVFGAVRNDSLETPARPPPITTKSCQLLSKAVLVVVVDMDKEDELR
jgi:hypothetical protein